MSQQRLNRISFIVYWKIFSKWN